MFFCPRITEQEGYHEKNRCFLVFHTEASRWYLLVELELNTSFLDISDSGSLVLLANVVNPSVKIPVRLFSNSKSQ